jgi:iron complex outermembrane recepter protein
MVPHAVQFLSAIQNDSAVFVGGDDAGIGRNGRSFALKKMEEDCMLNSNTRLLRSALLLSGASAFAFLALGMMDAAYAQDSIETVVVTGFRASLEKALDMKREALDASDSIMAEDIAKFPDMNVSESLQRIPGVSLQRESGEGREITVRGLGPQFTRVLINGIEAVANTSSQDVSTSGGGVNRGRGFDFNVFASDLFSQLTIHKSNSASMEEGSLGAIVDMHTAHPFDHAGFVFTSSAQYGYQEVAGSSNPRVSALVSDTFLGGRLGVLLSGAFAVTNTLEEGSSSVRFASNLATGTSANSTYDFGYYQGVATTASSEVNTAFHPRDARYDLVNLHEKRFGLTGSVQWQPDDNTLFSLDMLYADFAQVREIDYLESYAFSVGGTGSSSSWTDTSGTAHYAITPGVGSINVLSYTLGGKSGRTVDASGNAVSTKTITRLEATNVGLRSESRLDHFDTRFMEATLDGSHSFSEKFKVHALLGWTESHYHQPISTTVNASLGCTGTGTAPSTASCTNGAGTASDPYIYDYSKGGIALISTGNLDPTQTDNWFISGVSKSQTYLDNSYRSASMDFTYSLMDELKLSGGFDFRNFGFYQWGLGRTTSATSTTSDSSLSAAVRAVDLSTYTKTVSLRGVDVPKGSTTSWFAVDFSKVNDAIGLWDQSAFPVYRSASLSSTGAVREDDFGGWVQADWDTAVYGMPLRGNVGVRYVLTQERTSGYTTLNSAITQLNGHLVYHDFLPTMNVTLEPVDDFMVRLNAGYSLTRPDLTSLVPVGTVSVSGSNGSATLGNPKLQPMRSKNVDVAFEWYYTKGSMLSVAGFYKHLDNFWQTQVSSGLWSTNPFGFDEAMFVGECGGTGTDWSTITNSYCLTHGGEDMTWNFNTTKSVKGAPLFGAEINWQQQFDFLPHPFNNLGILFNYTYVQAQQNYYDTSGKLIAKGDLTSMSRNNLNTTVYYDDTVFQARLTGAFRSHFLINPAILTNYNNYGIYNRATFNLDASSSYKYDDHIMITLDALNLTDQAAEIVSDLYAQRQYQYHETGRVFYLGVKYTY